MNAYRDPKRYSWLLSLLVPASLVVGPAVYLWRHQAWGLWVPVAVTYILIPLLDMLIGEDRSNPPEDAVASLEADRYYRYITYALVAAMWPCIIFCAWFVATQHLPWHACLAVVISTGMMGGFCINVGHELGHKRTVLEQTLAKLVLAPTGYGHFYVEHNRGHHRHVATPDDPASARMGESIYAFALRELPGAWRRAWALERQRLGGAPWHWKNEVLQPLTLTILLWTALGAWLGAGILLFMLAMSLWANFLLTSANYIEHYGLLRQIAPNGKPEPCQPHHSWNSNHVVTNWMLFHLQRHSDHHAHASRRYQSLRNFDEVPRLPNGYFGMFLLAYVPPLFFAVMNPRLLEAVGRDSARINFQPGKRERLSERYGIEDRDHTFS
ncbi:alkane 1-monooxygenase [Massilia sp. TSP1-1-2]|uniref:alkane 1-monooxygenase n=1 Tax=Massilia sp. TSP1-1-2 TaxID=2804649 RepID=UPI003CEE4D2D